MKEHFQLPDSECERATRKEIDALRMLIALVSNANYGKKDLAKRLSIVPEGTERFEKTVGELNDLLQDIIGAISTIQAKALKNTLLDYEIRLVPKFTTFEVVIPVGKKDFMTFIDCAMERCKTCAEDGKTCRKCDLYNLLLSYVPLDDYGNDDDIICPYAEVEWQ